VSGTLTDLFKWWAIERRDELAIVTATDRVTHGEFDRWSDALADWLIAEGLEVGDRVTVYATNSLEWHQQPGMGSDGPGRDPRRRHHGTAQSAFYGQRVVVHARPRTFQIPVP
jgi:hypothetical protein